MVVSIDTEIWVTSWVLAKELNVTRQVVNNWMRRGKVEVWYIEELDIKLIKRNGVQKQHRIDAKDGGAD